MLIKNSYRFLKQPPEILIYCCKQTENNSVYKMAHTKTGNYIGEMIVHKQKFHYFAMETPGVDSLSIDYLKVFKRNQGFGTKFLNFAKSLSYEKGCNGNMHLISSACYDKGNPPHIFYRKYGFDSKNTKKLNEIDKAIITGKKNEFQFDSIGMFFPAKSQIGEALTLLEKIKLFLSRLTINLVKHYHLGS